MSRCQYFGAGFARPRLARALARFYTGARLGRLASQLFGYDPNRFQNSRASQFFGRASFGSHPNIPLVTWRHANQQQNKICFNKK
jgi:hypothetical protein